MVQKPQLLKWCAVPGGGSQQFVLPQPPAPLPAPLRVAYAANPAPYPVVTPVPLRVSTLAPLHHPHPAPLSSFYQRPSGVLPDETFDKLRETFESFDKRPPREVSYQSGGYRKVARYGMKNHGDKIEYVNHHEYERKPEVEYGYVASTTVTPKYVQPSEYVRQFAAHTETPKKTYPNFQYGQSRYVQKDGYAQNMPGFALKTQDHVQTTPEYEQKTPDYVQNISEYVQKTQEYPETTPNYAQKTPDYVQNTSEYVQRTQEYPETTPNYAQKTPDYVQNTSEYVQKTAEYVKKTLDYAQITPEYVHKEPEDVQLTPTTDQYGQSEPIPEYDYVHAPESPNYGQKIAHEHHYPDQLQQAFEIVKMEEDLTVPPKSTTMDDELLPPPIRSYVPESEPPEAVPEVTPEINNDETTFQESNRRSEIPTSYYQTVPGFNPSAVFIDLDNLDDEDVY